jgi:hypothetical protein
MAIECIIPYNYGQKVHYYIIIFMHSTKTMLTRHVTSYKPNYVRKISSLQTKRWLQIVKLKKSIYVTEYNLFIQ